MVGRRWWAVQSWKVVQKTLAIALAIQILLGNGSALATSLMTTAQLTETAPPKTFLDLGRVLDQYQPQIKIIAPKAGQLLSDNTVTVSFQLQDLPIYKDKSLGLGPHLHLVVDDQPYQSIYNASESIVLKDLEPGTHTVRIFAASPWDEAFKNDGAFAQVTFDVFTKTDDNRPQTQKPLLTYNQPQGTYGAEPILLDFYVTNAPLHLIAQESDTDSIQDWKVKATVNGQSFLLDRWQPTYLKGFKPGKNWVQLEFIDEKGNRVENFGNNTARVFNYEPGGQDSLAQLTRGEISIAQAKGIVDPTYTYTYTPAAPLKPIEPDVPAIKSTKSVDTPVPVKLAPNASKITPKISAPAPLAPIGKPTKPIEIKPDLEVQKEVQKLSPSIVETPDVKETLPNSASRRTIQEKLPSFIGPGKKIEVKTSVAPPAIVIVKPVEPKANLTPKTVKVPPMVEIDQKSSKTGIDSPKAVEPKTPTIDSDVPKKGNWFDRFRKSNQSAPDLNKDSTIKTDVPSVTSKPVPSSGSSTNIVPTLPVVPLPIVSPKKTNGIFSPPALELTKEQKILLSTQKESAIATRNNPSKSLSPGKKTKAPTVIPNVSPNVKPNADLKSDVIVKNKIQNTVKPITRTPIVTPNPEVVKPEAPNSSYIPKTIVKPEVVKPENQTKSEEPKSTTDGDSMKSLVDRLNKISTPTELKNSPPATEPSVKGDEVFNQSKSTFNPPKATPETSSIELPASKTAG